MTKPSWMTKACGVFLLWTTAAIALPAQTFTVLHSFDNTDGGFPRAGLVQGTNGKFYGTTIGGGAYGDGTVFSMTASGALTTLHSFDGTDGANPSAAPVQGTNGKFYGTTSGGGAYGEGTVFSMTASGTLTTLHSFADSATDGANPAAGLVQGANGKFYGTTTYGGANGDGTVFSITASGTLTILHSFADSATDGGNPIAGLVQGTNGDFYGTTFLGGAYDGGTVFSITASDTLTTLYSFSGADGSYPSAGLVQGANGKFYGTTPPDGGTVFSITANGTPTKLYTFCSGGGVCADGSSPGAALVQGTNGKFYGTTNSGGANGDGDGTVFTITASGALTTLHSFDGSDGEFPGAALAQGTNGKFYGTTTDGGANGNGTVFSLSVGLGPFVITQTTSGAEGVAVNILGSNLTGATSVTFNGTAAAFTVVSQYLITTIVPTGATSGKVEVIIPSATLSSSGPFHVQP
jgi:uncharacterized repeat protein (TIGR03803 family)